MLGDICQIAMGQSPSSDTYTMNKAGVPFFQGNADFGEENPIPRIWCNKPIKIANENDILISVRAPIGSINIANRKCCIGRGLAKITPNTCVYLRYLIWFLRSRTKFLQDNGTGTTFKAINKKQLETLPISLPSVNEQMQIGQVLDRLSSLINLKKKQYHVLDKLVKSQFVELFGNPQSNDFNKNLIKISAVADVVTGATPSRAKKISYYNGDIPWVKTGEIAQVEISEVEEYITDLAIKETNCKLLPINTIMLAMYGQGKTRGTVGILKMSAATNQACAAILPSAKYDPYFMLTYIQLMYEQIRSLGRGAQQANLNLSMVRNFPFPNVPISSQRQFGELRKKLDKSKFVVQQSIEKLELLKKSLMQQYFG